MTFLAPEGPRPGRLSPRCTTRTERSATAGRTVLVADRRPVPHRLPPEVRSIPGGAGCACGCGTNDRRAAHVPGAQGGSAFGDDSQPAPARVALGRGTGETGRSARRGQRPRIGHPHREALGPRPRRAAIRELVRHHEAAARSQNAHRLTQSRLQIRPEVDGLEGGDDVEAGRAERERLGRALHHSQTSAGNVGGVEPARAIDRSGGVIDGAHLGARQAQDSAHGGPAAAADVQDPRVRPDRARVQPPPMQAPVPQVHRPQREPAEQ